MELNNLDGETVRLVDFAGHPTAVLFWNPGCGFCQRMLDDLKSWETEKPEDAPKLLVVSSGEVGRNRELGLSPPVVLDSGFNVGRAFGASGTPSAVLVGADGKIASGLAVGGPDGDLAPQATRRRICSMLRRLAVRSRMHPPRHAGFRLAAKRRRCSCPTSMARK